MTVWDDVKPKQPPTPTAMDMVALFKEWDKSLADPKRMARILTRINTGWPKLTVNEQVSVLIETGLEDALAEINEIKGKVVKWSLPATKK